MKKSFYHHFSDFIEGKGFYIVLALCIAAIGISGWFLLSGLTGAEETSPVGGTASITVTPAPTAAASVRPVKPTVTATPRPTATLPAVAADTGAVSIPLMKKRGYPPEFAAACEASASEGTGPQMRIISKWQQARNAYASPRAILYVSGMRLSTFLAISRSKELRFATTL